MTSGHWTEPDDIAARVRRRWDDGALLRSYATGAEFPTIQIRLRGPSASEIGDDLGAARDWARRLDTGRRDNSRYDLEWAMIGGRRIGRNRVPSRAVISSYSQAWALLGVTGAVRRFGAILALVDDHEAVRDWVVQHPLRALELSEELPRLLAAFDWLDAHRSSDRYLREIAAPGVDTKFAERHRAVLADLLGVSRTSTGFLVGLGLRAKPEFVRLRFASSLGLPAPLTELGVRADQLADLDLGPTRALVIENEITYLSVDVPADGVVIWGKGFDVDQVGKLSWLTDADVVYWGDLDTHGFAILDRLRAWLPQTRSILMDRETLLTHRDRWVVEDRPATSQLTRLTANEADLYLSLVADAFGDRIRLEQERIDWSWVEQRLGRAFESPRVDPAGS
ncbi:Wadjet anti-phage system protein JetD domain-containing protein [Microlunatus sp. Gsoil 973]|uniref:Wadjet anti-phage system protein JetD domain-containing protein n=1 Tax=Microlunatus sp. Gsoil 973 TaxID=2672569 RepID=UPI0012B48D02|nr:DUF3322 and DUF2220 domain-containing protein [Microlunatus sp. Gsoil 973]QGN34424.1 hypothetical protein GJV80_18170 [Microlunatus sp. Gsoil 973]